MRVIAGKARRLLLKAPKGMDIRPTTDRTKETLFNILNPYIYDCLFLDIFSGSGAIGIEAISRGAKKAFFIENNQKAISCIKDNLIHTKTSNRAELLPFDFEYGLKMLKNKNEIFDIIFLDPPYNKKLEEKTIKILNFLELLNNNGIIVCESSTKTDFNFLNSLKGYEIFKTKEFKTSKFTFIKKVKEVAK